MSDPTPWLDRAVTVRDSLTFMVVWLVMDAIAAFLKGFLRAWKREQKRTP